MGKQRYILFYWAPKSLLMVTAAMKLNWQLILRRRAMTILDSILESRDITLPTKVHLVGVKVKVAQSCQILCDPMDYTVSPWNFPGQNTGVGSLSFLQGDLPNPGIEPRSLVLWADSLSAEPQGKPKNTEVDSLSLLQGIFPTQESNRGLLHCRRLLYQPSCEGSPISFSYMTFVMLLGSEFSCSG